MARALLAVGLLLPPLYTGAGGTPKAQQLFLAVCGAPLHSLTPRSYRRSAQAKPCVGNFIITIVLTELSLVLNWIKSSRDVIVLNVC